MSKRHDQSMNQPTAGRAVVSVILTVVMVVGSAAFALTAADYVQSRLGAATVTKAPTAKGISARKSLVLKGKVLQGPLIPGVRRPLKVTMKNSVNQKLKVTAVTVTPQRPAAAGCKKSWVKVTSFKANKKQKPIVIKPRKQATVMLKVQLKNLPSVNQDACKSTRLPLELKATARQA